jgi:hypothetical protein
VCTYITVCQNFFLCHSLPSFSLLFLSTHMIFLSCWLPTTEAAVAAAPARTRAPSTGVHGWLQTTTVVVVAAAEAASIAIAIDKNNIKANENKYSIAKEDSIALAQNSHRELLKESATGERSTEVLKNGNVEREIGHHFEYTVLLDASPPGSFQSAEEMDLSASPAELRKQMERALLAELKRLIKKS